MVLVDSTVWVDLLRKSNTLAVRRLRNLIEAGEAAVLPVIVQEVLQGARDQIGFGRLRAYFESLPLLRGENSMDLHISAAHLYARARWCGISPRSPNDCLVAASAVEADALLLHDDRDYEELARVESRLRLIPRS